MSCHKKCAVKAQAGAGCARTNPRRPSVQPEIITTPPDDVNAQVVNSLNEAKKSFIFVISVFHLLMLMNPPLKILVCHFQFF